MKQLFVYLAFVLTVVLLYSVAFATPVSSDPDGKKLFTEKKCNSCHAIESQQITTTSKKKNPDLSDTGSKFKADFLEKYLKKEEAIKDKKHPANFKGTDDELKKLSEWLAGLKK